MARLKFKNGIVKDYTIILSTRDYRHLGQLTGLKAVNNVHNLNSANELSFTICKHDFINSDFNKEEQLFDYETYLKLKQELWDQIVDLKLVYVKDLDEYFEIKVTITDAAETTKAITATSLCEAELSQTETGSLEINTEADVNRDDYYDDFPTVFYRDPNVVNTETDPYESIWEDKEKKDKYCIYKTDENGNKIVDNKQTYEHRYKILKNSSLLHRVLDNAPHYSIGDVAESLKNLQRTFTVDGTIYDFLTGACSEQFDCLFTFDTKNRKISAHDLYTVCNECGERGEFYDICPKCNSTNIKYFGDDTTILVDKNNLTESIQLNVNVDSIKNCFKLVAGDELMTAAIKDINSGSDYIYYFSENQLKDMPKELVDELDKYNTKVELYEEQNFTLVSELYDLYDKSLYLKSGMMPTIEYVNTYDELKKLEDPHLGAIYLCGNKVYRYDGSEFIEQNEEVEFYESLLPSSYHITSETEAAKLTVENLSPLGVKSSNDLNYLSNVNSSLKNYAKVYVKSGFVKVEVGQSGFIDDIHEYIDENGNKFSCRTWEGNFKITNYKDKEDHTTSETIQILVYDNYEEFIRQKILKNLPEDEDGSIFNVLKIEDLDKFKNAISLYCEKRLESFSAAIDNAISVIQSMEQTEDYEAYYEALYVPYWNKLCTIVSTCHDCNVQGDFLYRCPSCGSTNIDVGELAKRKQQIADIQYEIDTIELILDGIHNDLDLEKNLGEYYNTFCSYRREQKYSNENYITDGYSNAEILRDAKDFIEKAEKDIIKSGELQYTLSSTLNNLLVLPEFEPILDMFELGNWIRVKVDGVLYRLRLIGYTINFDSLQTINVEFSTISKVKDVVYEAQQILSSAKSMSSSYSYVSKQAEKGQEAKDDISDWKENSLNAALIQISNNDNEDVVFGNNGILCRSKDDISDTYSPKQLKLVHNSIVFTKDNWKTCSQAIGEHKFKIYDEKNNDWSDVNGYGMTSEFVTSGVVYGTNIYGGEIYSTNFKLNKDVKDDTYDFEKDRYDCIGSFIDLKDGVFSFGGKLTWDGKALYIDKTSIGAALSGENGVDVTAGKLKVKANNIDGKIESDQISGLAASKITGQLTSSQITSVTAEQIDTSSKKIQAEQIKTIDISQVTGTIVADSVDAENITGTIASTQIVDTLENKTISGKFSGEVTASAIATTIDETTYTGMTTDIVLENQTLHFVNGLLINVTTNLI